MPGERVFGAFERQTPFLDSVDDSLERSYLLHRLNLLGVPWGQLERNTGGKGTFHEVWRTQWQPEFSIRSLVKTSELFVAPANSRSLKRH